MSLIEKKQLDALCSNPDVRSKAQALLYQARSSTAPGTGYDVGNGKTGLPAICAYLASKRAGYDDVDYNVAQSASCLDKKVFSKTLKLVQAALNVSKNATLTASRPSSPQKVSVSKRGPPSYPDLISKHTIGRPRLVAGWMESAEKTLLKSEEFLKNYQMAPGSMPVKIAVFMWVCRMIKSPKVKSEPLTAQYGVPMPLHARLVATVEHVCPDVEADIKKHIEVFKAERNLTRKSTSKKAPAVTGRTRSHTVQLSPTKSSLRNSQSATPSGSGLKRKVAFSDVSEAGNDEDDGIFVPESPSKRQRRSSPYKTPHTPAARDVYDKLEMPAPPAALTASLSNVTLDSDSDVEMADVDASHAQNVLAPASATAPTSKPARRSAYRSAPDVPMVDPLAALSDDGDNAGDAGVTAQENVETTAEGQEGDEEDEEEMLPPIRRFRPVLLDRAQWAARAPTLEKQWAVAEKNKQAMLKKWAHPFEWMRVQTMKVVG